MDKEMTARNAKKYRSYMKSNPFIIYYEDRSVHELRKGKDYPQQSYVPPVYLPG
jgi:hypothetical protein